MNVREMKARVKTLQAAIEDAESRIASNPTDAHYVQTQRDKQRRWRREAQTLNKQIAEATTGANRRVKW